MAGGKGGSTTSSVQIPEYIERAAQRNLNRADRIAQIGYTPYYGPDVAGFTPSQQAAFQNVADTAGAFGLAAPTAQQDVMGGLPAPTQYAGGVSGYSSAPLYEQAIDELAAQRPAQKSFIDSFFIDPVTGQGAYAPIDYTQLASGSDERAVQRANDLAVAALSGGQGPVSATNEGIFGSGDYNEAFTRNYDAAAADAAINPYGSTTGTPIYDQGYIGLSDPVTNLAGSALNNSLIGRAGEALTGSPMLADVSSLLPPTDDRPKSGGGVLSDIFSKFTAPAKASSSSAPRPRSRPDRSGTDAGDGMVWEKKAGSNVYTRTRKK